MKKYSHEGIVSVVALATNFVLVEPGEDESEKEILVRRFQAAVDLINERPEMQEILYGLLAIEEETGRGAALVGAAMVEEVLKHLLRSIFVSSDVTTDLLREGGILGSYRARADLAFSLGLLDMPEREALVEMAKVRNRFAHRPGATFDANENLKI